MMIDEYLAFLLGEHSPIVLTLTTVCVKLPGEGGLNKFKRGDKYTPTPFMDGIYHLTRQHIILGGNYQQMVNEERQAEFKRYLDKLPPSPRFIRTEFAVEQFIAEELWHGKGIRDSLFPRFVAVHKDSGQRYLCFRPVSYNPSGTPDPLDDEFYDATTLRKLDFDKEVKDYYRPASKQPKVQMTAKMVPWRTVKLENVVGATYKRHHTWLETPLDFPRQILGR